VQGIIVTVIVLLPGGEQEVQKSRGKNTFNHHGTPDERFHDPRQNADTTDDPQDTGDHRAAREDRCSGGRGPGCATDQEDHRIPEEQASIPLRHVDCGRVRTNGLGVEHRPGKEDPGYTQEKSEYSCYTKERPHYSSAV
jgi:hypothetical protein